MSEVLTTLLSEALFGSTLVFLVLFLNSSVYVHKV